MVPSVAEPGNPDAEAMSGVHEGEEVICAVLHFTEGTPSPFIGTLRKLRGGGFFLCSRGSTR